MINEIGSEFWKVEKKENNNHLVGRRNVSYLLSGRTCLDHIIKDIKAEKTVSSAYLPSFCCHSMIQPFLDNDLKVEFYSVYFHRGRFCFDIDYSTTCDVVLLMQYFGFVDEEVNKSVDALKAKGKSVIEDATHSWFSENPFSINSDYSFASFRKWTGLSCGAVTIKQKGDFSVPQPQETNLFYIEIRETAKKLKKDYLGNNTGNKNEYLDLFKKAESLLEKDYREYTVPYEIKQTINFLDYKKIQNRRKENARILATNLRPCRNLEFIMPKITDVPLFFPIFMDEKVRDELQNFLITKNVYCPIHWPISSIHRLTDDKIYKTCLSLICDQRYSEKEMNFISALIFQFFGGKD